MIWNGLPMIRREIAECMINNFGLTQKEAAEKLGVTPAAICQYLSKKRGNSIEISNEIIREEIRTSTKKIIEDGDGSVIQETCRICKIMRIKKQIPLSCESCDIE
jgi:hypothetical protein